MAEFLHGVQVVNIDGGSRSIAVASTSVIGIVGTAPRADKIAFPYNTPVLVTSRSQAAKLLAGTATEADDGTLPGQLDAIFDQSNAVVVVVRVEKGATENDTLANVLGGVNAQTGAYTGVHA
ncbi:phage tail protein, partial [Stenotrophomonas maltophilia]|nr:phage tail protein [Stenotrophomonas maltophilia]